MYCESQSFTNKQLQRTKKVHLMSTQNHRRSKAKLSCLNSYKEKMSDYVSSSEEEYIQTDYEPEVILTLEDDEQQLRGYQQQEYDDGEIQLEGSLFDEGQAKYETQKLQGIKGVDNILLKQLKYELDIGKKEEDHPNIKYESYHAEIKNKQDCDNQEVKKKEESFIQSSSQHQKISSQNNLSSNQTTSISRKKNIFLSKDQKQRLTYDIKSQRFLLPDLTKKYGISRSTIKRYLSQINTYGEILIPNQKTRVVSGSKQNKIHKFIKQSIEKNPFLSQKQMALMIKQEMNINVSQQTVSLILKKSNITKKKGMITYKEGNTDENIQKRYEYANIYERLNEDRVIFMDQTGFNECVQVQYGYAPRGKRLLKQKSGKKGHKIVVILSMTYDRICHWDIVNLSVKTEHVASYIKQFSKQFRGYTLIMDNARVHKTQQVSQAVVSVGLNPLFLPPYSPQLNPIQLIFGRLKTIYKSMMGVKLQQPQIQLSEKVNSCLKILSESKLESYKRPVNFWIKQALKKKKFNEVVQQKQ